MINPPTECFFTMYLEGEAAEFVAATCSESVTSDIKEAILISQDFSNDISATISLDSTVERVKESLAGMELIEHEYINPLYTASTPEQLDTVLEGDVTSEQIAFTGADGNPFTMKMVEVINDNRDLVQAKLSCKPFELPSYNEIMHEHANLKLN